MITKDIKENKSYIKKRYKVTIIKQSSGIMYIIHTYKTNNTLNKKPHNNNYLTVEITIINK